MKKYTVLGGNGYIGKNLATYLRALGHDVFAPERGESLLSTKSLGCVFYCIGITADFRKRPYDTVRAHISILSDILEQNNFDKLVYLSSTRIYNSAESGHEESNFIVNPANCSDLYNLSKLTGESLCLSSHPDKVQIVRLSNVVGRQNVNSNNFLATLCREAKSGKILLQTSLTSSKDYIHIDDAIELIVKIACYGHYNIYNVASGIQTTHLQIINLLKKLTGCTCDVSKNAPEVMFRQIDISRICKEFNFTARFIIDDFSSIDDM